MLNESARWFWLCVLPELPPAAEVQAFLNGDLDALSHRVADADQFWLGESDPAHARPPTTSADRVAALLSAHSGMTEEDALPVLDRGLMASILKAYAPDGTVEFPCFPVADLLRFLRSRTGGFAFVRVGGSDTSDPADGEMDRLMRQHAASVNRNRGARTAMKTARRLDRGPDPGDEPDDGGEDGPGGGVREPRRPRPTPPPVSAAVDADEDQPTADAPSPSV